MIFLRQTKSLPESDPRITNAIGEHTYRDDHNTITFRNSDRFILDRNITKISKGLTICFPK